MRILGASRAACSSRLGLLAPILWALSLGSCAKPNTMLVVNVEDASGTLTSVYQLKVRVLIGRAISEFFAPPLAGGPISFPTSFTVEVDRALTGPLSVDVGAVSKSGVVIAESSATLPAVSVGSKNTVVIRLTAPTPDAGADAGPDAGTDGSPGGATDGPREGGAGDVGSADALADGPPPIESGVDGPGNADTGSVGGTSGAGGASGMGGAPGDPGTGGVAGAGGAGGAGGESWPGVDAGADGDAGDVSGDAANNADPDAPVD